VHLFRQYFFAKKLQSQNLTIEKLRKALLYEKLVSKMLMKLTPDGVIPCFSFGVSYEEQILISFDHFYFQKLLVP